MRRDIKERECNECSKIVSQSEIMFGGSPFGGWLQISLESFSLTSSSQTGPWDFCDLECAIDFLNKLKKGSKV